MCSWLSILLATSIASQGKEQFKIDNNITEKLPCITEQWTNHAIFVQCSTGFLAKLHATANSLSHRCMLHNYGCPME